MISIWDNPHRLEALARYTELREEAQKKEEEHSRQGKALSRVYEGINLHRQHGGNPARITMNRGTLEAIGAPGEGYQGTLYGIPVYIDNTVNGFTIE